MKPAKIMQQQHVIAELGEYLDSMPRDAPSTSLVLRYLLALQKLFEAGFLTHEKITSLQSPILAGMASGYKFFSDWLDPLLDQGLIPINPYQKCFLAWQTWDLLRISWLGLRNYCEEMFSLHPECYVIPLRANGSAIETIFSQLKHASGHSLTAVNYETARAQLLTRRSVHGVHVKEDYRNAPLYIKDSELPTKKKPRKS